MRVFMTKSFARFVAREDIDDGMLWEAAERADAGRIDADLGGGVIKQRIARRGEGKSGGFRTILLFRRGAIAVFAYGFAKSDRGNIRPDELKAFRRLANEVCRLDDAALGAAVRNGTLKEVGRDE